MNRRLRVRPKLLLFCLLMLSGVFVAQVSVADWTDWLGAEGHAMIRARLRDKAENAGKHTAAVEVEVQNIWLHYPDEVVEPGIQVGALQYRIDDCPTIVTTETRLRFEELGSGDHTITVGVLGGDNRLVTPRVHLVVTIQ
ncbi:MAG TPA: hypothetical protein VJP02_24955 [Candidatus Sulfotelmatobacter sp.]|nr:hypothetical protein [Candidatus Sulfotelmatobacter sp.]